jgi:hypothetical protein
VHTALLVTMLAKLKVGNAGAWFRSFNLGRSEFFLNDD